MFYATPEQKANATVYLNALVSDPKAVKFYQDNGIKQPTIGQIVQAATTDAQARGAIASQTVLAALAAGSLALAPAFSGIASEAAAFLKDPKTYCLANPAGCTVGLETGICAVAGAACPPTSLVPVVKVPSGSAGVAKSAPGVAAVGSATPPIIETTSAVVVSGSRAIDKAQSYENAVQGMYTNAPLADRQFTAVVNGQRVRGIADDVAIVAGRDTAIEAKFVDDWVSSIRNPASPNGTKPWAVAEQQNMVDQATKYSAAFDGGVVYHTNSADLAAYYTKVFNDAGIKNFKFVITPTKPGG